MRGRNVNTSRQFTNFPPLHQARLTKHYKTLVGQEKFLGEKELLWSKCLSVKMSKCQNVEVSKVGHLQNVWCQNV